MNEKFPCCAHCVHSDDPAIDHPYPCATCLASKAQATPDTKFAYFAKHASAGWVLVSSNCSLEDTVFFDKHINSVNGYMRTKIVELD